MSRSSRPEEAKQASNAEIKVTSSVSTTEYTSFDILGRVTASKQTTDGGDSAGYTTGYTYNLSGALMEETYPSGRIVKNELDVSGDLSQVSSKENSSAIFKTYANDFTYNAAGAVTSLKLGNGRFESTQFNSRLQPTQIALGASVGDTGLLKLAYGYGTTANNGNVLTQDITVKRPGTSDLVFDQTYTYDELNRLRVAEEKTGSTTNWKQTFTFDRYGNRRFDEANTTMPTSFANQALTNPTISTSNNRLTSTGWTYDAAGNTIGDPDGRSFTYDGENKQAEVKNSSNVSLGQYSYDGDGKRVKKVAGDEVTIFVYDASGKSIAEYSTIVASVEDAKVAYLTADHLGSPRINTDRDGKVTARHDYHPFGEEIDGTGGRKTGLNYGSDSVRKQFTGYEHDKETDLDFAETRMYAKGMGRFLATDPALSSGRPNMPQSWNRYSYAANSPLRFSDPSGLFEWAANLQEDPNESDEVNKHRADLRQKILAAYDKARAEIDKAMNGNKLSADKLKKLNDALNALGPKPGQAGSDNGVTVGTGVPKVPNAAGETTPNFTYNQGTNKGSAAISVILTEGTIKSGDLFVALLHESSHVNDMQLFAADGVKMMTGQSSHDITQYQSEYNAFEVNSYLFEAMGTNGSKFQIPVWNNSWAKVDAKLPPLEQSRKTAIGGYISAAYKDVNGIPLTPSNQGASMTSNGVNVVH